MSKKHISLLIVIFLAALTVRSIHINDPKPQFRAWRQFRSFEFARAIFLNKDKTQENWKKDVANSSVLELPTKEPQVIENIVAMIYSFIGKEEYWVPSLINSLIWLAGGGFIYLIAVRMDKNAALFSLAFYMFNPFGIIISRSFQPEALLVAMFAASIFLIVKYHEKPTLKRLIIAGVISGLAVMVKLVIIFHLAGAFLIATGIGRKKNLSKLFSIHNILWLALSMLPGAAYYIYHIFITKELGTVASKIFRPDLIATRYFWVGWILQLGIVTGLLFLLAAIIGTAICRDNTIKKILIGLFGGHFLYCLIFTYTTPTHDYYQVQLIPMVAIAMTPFVAVTIGFFQKNKSYAFLSFLLLAGLFSVCLYGIHQNSYKSKSWNVRVPMNLLLNCFGLHPDYVGSYLETQFKIIDTAKQIGQAVNHSTKTILLGAQALNYDGQFTGPLWPNHYRITDDWEKYGKNSGPKGPHHYLLPDKIRKDGKDNIKQIFMKQYYPKRDLKWKACKDVKEIFDRYFKGGKPEYFVITNFAEFEIQQDLRDYLYKNYKLKEQTDSYIIFDLTNSN